MHLPPLQLPGFAERVIIGLVELDPTVAIAPGVILQADPNCKIEVGAGAVVGMGVIIHARAGNLEIGAGVNLGAGGLIVGKGKIGSNCCIGACSTLVDPELQPGEVVSAGSLLVKQETQPASELATSATKVAVTHAKAHLQQFMTRIQLG
mgnify:CR=1 FL=1